MSARNWNPLGLTDLEIASGLIVGEADEPIQPDYSIPDPIEALGRAMDPALESGQCFVSFSGGRDSSAVLALAVNRARHRGVALPVPVSLRFAGVAEAEESEFQEAVVRHLGLHDWITVDVADELDLLGPYFSEIAGRSGLLWPPNTHFHGPIFEQATGGHTLTGVDGDGLFGGWRWQRRRGARTTSEAMRRLLHEAHAIAPRAVRRTVALHRDASSLDWLTSNAARVVWRSWADERADEPRTWSRRVVWFARRRYLELVRKSLQLAADRWAVTAHHPFLDPAFLGSLARFGGPRGLGSRADMTRRLFGDFLPEQLLDRRTKATFRGPLVGSLTKAFADSWTGKHTFGEDRVDSAQLRRAWLSPSADFRSFAILQAIHLAEGTGED